MDTAEAMLRTGRYIYAVFMCQQALEKCFKALIAYLGGDVLPIHNLRRLAEFSKVKDQLDKEQMIKLDFLSQYYITARYKEDIAELSRGITEVINVKYFFLLATIKIPVFIFGCNLSYTSCFSAS